MSSLFSQIIAGELPGHFIFQDQRWVAFLDIFPVRPGHVLLVPRQENQYLADQPGSYLAESGLYLAALSRCVKQVCAVKDVAIILRDGPNAGQIVPHVHWHVVPRAAGDKQHDFASGRYAADDAGHQAGLEAMASRLRAAWRGI